MKPQLAAITLAVNSLAGSLKFYRDGLGLATKGIVGTEFPGSASEPAGAVAFFELQGGLLLALYPRSELSKDVGIADGPPNSLEFTLAYFADSQEAVDELLHRAQLAGATLPQPAHDRAWGIYSGYFRDPDGHLWEVIWNRATPAAG
jgi:catechol 2,3-dioxygenase-like lactoylglutathione lyase family enzyme